MQQWTFWSICTLDITRILGDSYRRRLRSLLLWLRNIFSAPFNSRVRCVSLCGFSHWVSVSQWLLQWTGLVPKIIEWLHGRGSFWCSSLFLFLRICILSFDFYSEIIIKSDCFGRYKLFTEPPAEPSTMMSWCLMSSDAMRHIRDKLWPMPKHGSINLYVHGNQKAR